MHSRGVALCKNKRTNHAANKRNSNRPGNLLRRPKPIKTTHSRGVVLCNNKRLHHAASKRNSSQRAAWCSNKRLRYDSSPP